MRRLLGVLFLFSLAAGANSPFNEEHLGNDADPELLPKSHASTCACAESRTTYVEKCAQGKVDTVPFDKDGTFLPECAPDTLYSWMSPQKLALYRAAAFEPKFNRGRFFFRTPLGSFGYGERSVRIKLKSGTKFKLVKDGERPSCGDGDALSPRYKDTVFIWQLNSMNIQGYSEYVICSSDMIESWSTGTPEHLREMEAERDWLATHPSKMSDKIEFGKDFTLEKGKRASTAIIDKSVYGADWSLAALSRRLRVMKNIIQSEKGTLEYATGVTPDRKAHFESKVQNYWNCSCPL